MKGIGDLLKSLGTLLGLTKAERPPVFPQAAKGIGAARDFGSGGHPHSRRRQRHYIDRLRHQQARVDLKNGVRSVFTNKNDQRKYDEARIEANSPRSWAKYWARKNNGPGSQRKAMLA